MSLTHFPSTYAHGPFAFNAHINADGTPNHANLLNTVRIDDEVENPGFRSLQDPYHVTQGGQLGRVHKGFRALEIQGTIIAPEGSKASRVAAIEDYEADMRSAFDPSICYRDSPGTDGAYALTYIRRTADLVTYPSGLIPQQRFMRPAGQPYLKDTLKLVGQRTFRLPMVMADPRTFAQTVSTLSTTTSGSANNRGDTAAPLKAVITLSGAGASNFSIARAGTTFVMDLSGLVASNVVTVVFETCAVFGRGRYITVDGTENARLKTSAPSTWLDVPVGANTFTISHATNVSSCVLSWYDSWA